MQQPPALSLRRRLLTGILVPVVLFIALDTYLLYKNALQAVNVAYDRTLLASAQAIGEQLSLRFENGEPVVRANVQYSSLEVFQTDVLSRFAYRVSDSRQITVDGDADLANWTGQIPSQSPYAALVDFYDDRFRGDPVRVAVLLQPLATPQGSTMVTIQVAETLELRQRLARNMLTDTLLRQLALTLIIGLITVLVVQWATKAVRQLRDQVLARPEGDLSPINGAQLPRELAPLLVATNQAMHQLQTLLTHQKRFIRDTSHQLRTPLAVLKTQVQSALRGDVEPRSALTEISHTVDRATQLANQMLAMAKVVQVTTQKDYTLQDWALPIREVVIDLSPLIAEKNLNFDIETTPCWVLAHTWMLKELTRNLLHNAIKFAPHDSQLSVRLTQAPGFARLSVTDQGPGLSAHMQSHLFQPFATGDQRTGTGLGLSICHEIVQNLNGQLRLIHLTDSPAGQVVYPRTPEDTRRNGSAAVMGLRCEAWIPLATAVAEPATTG